MTTIDEDLVPAPSAENARKPSSLLLLPSEMWLSIFLRCVHIDIGDPTPDTLTRPRITCVQPLHLSHVCGAWRALVLQSGVLWSYIDLTWSFRRRHNVPDTVLDTVIARSGDSTLHLKTYWYPEPLSGERAMRCLPRARVLHLLFPAVLDPNTSQKPDFITQAYPHLHRLILTGPTTTGTRPSLTFVGKWRSLRALELHRITIHLPTLCTSLQSSFVTLETLELDCCVYREWEGSDAPVLRTLLCDAAQLTSFSITQRSRWEENWMFEHPFVVPLPLPNLRHLAVASDSRRTVANILSSVQTAAALNIRVLPYSEPESDTIHDWETTELDDFLPQETSHLTAFARSMALSVLTDPLGRVMFRTTENAVLEDVARTPLLVIEPAIEMSRFGDVFGGLHHLSFEGGSSDLRAILSTLCSAPREAPESSEGSEKGSVCPALGSLTVRAGVYDFWDSDAWTGATVKAIVHFCEARAQLERRVERLEIDCPEELLSEEARMRLEKAVRSLSIVSRSTMWLDFEDEQAY